jgi:hypothetical protein
MSADVLRRAHREVRADAGLTPERETDDCRQCSRRLGAALHQDSEDKHLAELSWGDVESLWDGSI